MGNIINIEMGISIGDEILTLAKDFLGSVRKNKNWDAIFVKTGDFLINDFDRSDLIIKELSDALSVDNLKELASKTGKDNGFIIKDHLYNEALAVFKKNDIPSDSAKLYADNFVIAILGEIEKNDPEKYREIYLANIKDDLKKESEKIEKRIDVLRDEIKKISTSGLKIKSAAQVEHELLRSTDNPKIDFSFFTCDDDQFIEEFNLQKNNERIYVKCQCKEEGIYCILNQFNKEGEDRPILVVENEEGWNNLSHLGIRDSILIPWFYANEIVAVEGNTNIFVYGDEEPVNEKKCIHMRRRTKDTIQKSLVSAGKDYLEAYRLVKETHGLYIPLKKQILNGSYNKKPNWALEDRKITLAVLLCGRWTEKDTDKRILSRLAEVVDYKTISDVLDKYRYQEDPFVLKKKESNKEVYFLASTENSWNLLGQYIETDSDLWKTFTSLLYQALASSKQVKTIPYKEKEYSILQDDHTLISDQLKEGMLRSLIMKSFYSNYDQGLTETDRLVSDVLKSIDSSDKWMHISPYIQLLCEASPDAVMDRLEYELRCPTGLVDFVAKTDGRIYHYDSELLYGIQQLLLYKRLAIRMVRWMLALDDCLPPKKDNHLVKELLESIFCTWHNFSALTADEKKQLAHEMFKIDRNAWDILYENLPFRKTTIASNITYPQYRDTDSIEKTSVEEMRELNDEYLKLCVEYADDDPGKWSKLIVEAGKYPESTRKEVLSKSEEATKQMDDDKKLIVCNTLKEQIHRNRFYSSASWALKETGVIDLYGFLSRIQFNDPIYGYADIFSVRYNRVVLFPVSYNSKNSLEENETEYQKEIANKIESFRNSGLSIKELIMINDSDNHTTMGEDLAVYYSKRVFDPVLFADLIKLKNKVFARDYAKVFACDRRLLDEIIRIGKNNTKDNSFVALLYSLQKIEDVRDALILKEENQEIKREFWKNVEFYGDSKEVLLWKIENCVDYVSFDCYIELLHHSLEYLSPDQIYNFLLPIIGMPHCQKNDLSGYFLKEVLDPVQCAYLDKPECKNISEIEMKYFDLLDWEDMKCTKRELSFSPEIYLNWARIIYKKENTGNDLNQNGDHLSNRLFNLFYTAKFCPAEIDGEINYSLLCKWIDCFKDGLIKQDQLHLKGHLLGRLFANSPMGNDGYYPHEAIRKAIEEFEYDEELVSSYCTEVFNSRGIFTPTAGKEEKEISLIYQRNANHIRTGFPRTAAIYDRLALIYSDMAQRERAHAEEAD